jgi:hypothetical protein
MIHSSDRKGQMHSATLLVFSFALLFVTYPRALGTQQTGRFADLKAQAFSAFDTGRYAEVAGKLEEVWEEDQSDPKVAEYLAMGYLYGERDLSKAQPLMEKAIALGGQATFLVVHSHERMGLLHGDLITEFCSGKMSVSPGKLTFIADRGEHTVTISAAELKDFSVPGGAVGRIHIKSLDKSYTFRVKTQSRGEAVLLGRIAEQNLKR